VLNLQLKIAELWITIEAVEGNGYRYFMFAYLHVGNKECKNIFGAQETTKLL
jgi:hypothetical protein